MEIHKINEALGIIMINSAKIEAYVKASLRAVLTSPVQHQEFLGVSPPSDERGDTALKYMKEQVQIQMEFIELKFLRPLNAYACRSLLCTYLKHNRPSFWSKHEKLLKDELEWVASLRNSCAHGVLNSTKPLSKKNANAIFSVHLRQEKGKQVKAPRAVSQKDIDKTIRIREELEALMMNELLLAGDEIGHTKPLLAEDTF